MELKLLKSVWGMTGALESQLQQISEAGYSGVELGLPSRADETQLKELLEKFQLDLVLQIYTDGNHIDSFEQQVQRAALFKPLLINSHSARDSMPYDEQTVFFERALAVEKEALVPVAHETHRGRSMFTPWNTAQLLRDFPDLRITADFSHWCCVCESMLQDQAENLSIAIERTVHIHARVGYEEGPQVTDFRAPEFEYALAQHEEWWDDIYCHLRDAGRPYLTVTAEFGPPGYLHTLPYTNQPVADLWELCHSMTARFRERFSVDKRQ